MTEPALRPPVPSRSPPDVGALPSARPRPTRRGGARFYEPNDVPRTDPDASDAGKRFRLLLLCLPLALGVTVALTIYSGHAGVLEQLRYGLRDEGFVLVVFYFCGATIGVVLHSIVFARYRHRIAVAWLSWLVAVGHGILVAVLAWVIVSSTGTDMWTTRSGAGRHYDLGAGYAVWLVLVLVAAPLGACATGFIPPEPAQQTRRGRLRWLPGPLATIVFCWIAGAAPFLLLMLGVGAHAGG